MVEINKVHLAQMIENIPKKTKITIDYQYIIIICTTYKYTYYASYKIIILSEIRHLSFVICQKATKFHRYLTFY